MFIEFQTYRFRAHSMFDPDLYRDRQEIERWKEQDPIVVYTKRLIAAPLTTDDEIEGMWESARRETEQAVEYAERAPLEPVETLEEHVLFEGGGER